MEIDPNFSQNNLVYFYFSEKAEKANVSKHTDRKIMSGLSEEQRNELLKYPDLVKQLSH